MRGDSSGNIILERDGSVRSEPESSRLAKKTPNNKKTVCSGDVDGIHPTSERLNE